MVLKELILTVSNLGRCGSLERTDLTVSTLKGVAVLKELILTLSFGKVWQLKELILTG